MNSVSNAFLCRKKAMRPILVLACLAATFCSCTPDLPYGAFRHHDTQEALPPGETGDEGGDIAGPAQPVMKPVFNIVLAEYPDGYDWLRDPDYGIISCTISLMQNGTALAAFEAGHASCISTDLDMVRCIDGHVYTDYSTSSETVIKRDGEELFRYPGREMMAGFACAPDAVVYTLGIPRDGDGSGWTLRRNGEPVASSSGGVVISGMQMEEGGPSFAYLERHELVSGTDTTWHLFRNMDETEMILDGPDEILADFMVADGAACVLSWDRTSGEMFLYGDGDDSKVTVGNDVCRPGTLLSDGTDIYVLGMVCPSGEQGRMTLWKGCGQIMSFDDGFTVLACYPDGEHIGAVGYYGGSQEMQYLFHDGEYVRLPDGYGLASPSLGSFLEGHYCLCLNPLAVGEPPLCIIDGEKSPQEVNGCFIALGHVWERIPSP